MDSLLGHKADTTSPALRRVVEEVVNAETVFVLAGKRVKLVLEQDVIRVNVGVDKVELSLVVRVLECRANDLEARRQTGTASDHAKVSAKVGRVAHLTLGTLDRDGVADLELAEVLRDVALLVSLQEMHQASQYVSSYLHKVAGLAVRAHLDDEVEVAEIIIRRGRGVRAHDLLAVDLGRHRDVLSNRQTQDVILAGETKAVPGGRESECQKGNRAAGGAQGVRTVRCCARSSPSR